MLTTTAWRPRRRRGRWGSVGRLDSYSWPAGSSQARMSVLENVRRYARNYTVLSLIFLACSLYQMPIPLLGIISSLLLQEVLKFFGDKWEMEEKHPGLRQALVRIVQYGELLLLNISYNVDLN